MVTIMAGLACGEPNTISWDILKNHVDTFVASPDWVAARGMRMLAAPVKGDQPVTSGESGAAPFGTLACIMAMDEYRPLREHLGLDENSKVLLFLHRRRHGSREIRIYRLGRERQISIPVPDEQSHLQNTAEVYHYAAYYTAQTKKGD